MRAGWPPLGVAAATLIGAAQALDQAGLDAQTRPHLRGSRLRPAALRAGALAARRLGLRHRRAPCQRRLRHRPLRRRHRRAAGAGRRRAAGAARPEERPGHRRLRLVGRQRQAPHLHQHREGVAAEHARRLLGARDRVGQADAARRQGAGLDADVRQVLTRCHPRRLRARQRPVRRAAGRRPDHAADDHRLGDDHQRHLGLGLRGGTGRARRLPLEPRRPPHRLLAVRHLGRRHLHAAQQHRQRLPGRDEDPVSQARFDQLGGADRRRRGRRRRHDLDADARRSARQLPGPARVAGRRRARHPAAEPAAEPAGPAQRRRPHRPRSRGSSAIAPRPGWTWWTRCAGWTRAASSCGSASATAGGTSTWRPRTAPRRRWRRSSTPTSCSCWGPTPATSGSTSSPRPTIPPAATCIAPGPTVRAPRSG